MKRNNEMYADKIDHYLHMLIHFKKINRFKSYLITRIKETTATAKTNPTSHSIYYSLSAMPAVSVLFLSSHSNCVSQAKQRSFLLIYIIIDKVSKCEDN